MFVHKPCERHCAAKMRKGDRVYGDEPDGVIVDLIGLADPLADELATQRPIVLEIEGDRRLVVGNRELIERFEQRIGITLARVRGHDETP